MPNLRKAAALALALTAFSATATGGAAPGTPQITVTGSDATFGASLEMPALPGPEITADSQAVTYQGQLSLPWEQP